MQAVLTFSLASVVAAAVLAHSDGTPYIAAEGRCSCATPPDVRKALRDVPHVFLGEIIATRDTLWPLIPDSMYVEGSVMTIRIVRRWKGTDADTVSLISSGMCDFRFRVGTRAVVFAYGEPRGMTTSICLPTVRAEQAQETLRLLGPPRRR